VREGEAAHEGNEWVEILEMIGRTIEGKTVVPRDLKKLRREQGERASQTETWKFWATEKKIILGKLRAGGVGVGRK